MLKPVISASNEAITGNIVGVVDPAESASFIYAIADVDTLSSTKADTSYGSFKLVGLEEATYRVFVDTVDEVYESSDTTGIEVSVGETSNVGTIELSEIQ